MNAKYRFLQNKKGEIILKDYLVKVLAYAVRTTETVGEAQRRHNTWPTASAALGRTMTAGLMLGAMLKGEEKITIKIEGRGPLGIILVDANARGEVRGYVTNPQTHLAITESGKLDVGGAVGTDGTLRVVKDIGLRDYFTGQVPLVSGEIAEDFAYYLATSEQIPSSVGLGVLVNTDNSIQAAGGFMIQMLPGAEEQTISAIEERLKTIAPVSSMIQEGLTPEEILEQLLGPGEGQVLERMEVKFKCSCSRERIAGALASLGPEEIKKIIDEDDQAEAICHFCNKKYFFSREELEKMLN